MQVRCDSKTGRGNRDFFEVCIEWGCDEAAAQWDADSRHFIAELHGHPIRAYHDPGHRDAELRLFIGVPEPGAKAFEWSRTSGWRRIGDKAKAPEPATPADPYASDPKSRTRRNARAKAKRQAEARGQRGRP